MTLDLITSGLVGSEVHFNVFCSMLLLLPLDLRPVKYTLENLKEIYITNGHANIIRLQGVLYIYSVLNIYLVLKYHQLLLYIIYIYISSSTI